jgi:curli biogenesis system outer membrane secretion channel CsgG
MLIKAGYKVIQGKPNIASTDQNDEYFDIVKRIEAGDFNGADYVLYGVLTGIAQNTHSYPITGTANAMSINNLEIAIDFSLIDTKTHRVVPSFIASGSASDNRIDGEAEGYKPNITKMLKQLSGNLSESVAYHLASQDFITSEFAQVSNSSRVIPGTDKYRYDERNLRVYK